MNLLYLDEIERNINRIKAEGGFDGCQTVLFGANKPTEKMIISLRTRNIEPVCVIDNNPKVTGKFMCGVRITTPQEGIAGIERDALVLIASKYYDEMKKQLVMLGCREDRIYQMVAYQVYSVEQADFDKAAKEIYSGYRCHQSLLAEFGENTQIIMCPYNGIGDMYFIGAYLDDYCSKKGFKQTAVTVVSNTCMRVAKMFGITNVKKLEQQDSDALMKYASYMGQTDVNITVFTHTSIHWDVLINFEKADRLSWGEMFLSVLMGVGTGIKNIPVHKTARDKAEEFMRENGLVCGRTAIISPYANTIIGLEDGIWEEIITCLKNKGYAVYTNSTGAKEPALRGTLPITFPIETAREVVELAGVFVGIRSGLCDVIENAQAKIFVLYPDNRQMFFSLKTMGFGKYAREIDCEKENAAEVIGRIPSLHDLTVILLTYNREERYLRAAIEGIVNQTMQDFEFIIYDNGSTTTDVAKIAADYPKARVVRQEENKKSFEHWSDFRNLSSEFLVVTHDDDIMRPGMLEEEYSIMKSAPDIKMAGCNVSIINGDGAEMFPQLFYEKGEKTEFGQNALLIQFATSQNGARLTYPSVMHRKSVLDKIDFSFFKTVGKGDDLYLMFSIDKLPGRTVISNKCLYEYRVHKGQDSRHAVEVLESGKKSLELLHGVVDEEEISRRKRAVDMQIADTKANSRVRDFIRQRDFDISEMLKIYQENMNKTEFEYEYQTVMFFSQVTAWLKERYKNKAFEYIIWGLGSGGQKTKYLLDLWYPESKCILYLDSWQHGGEKNGIPICNVNEFKFDKKNLIFLCGAPVQNLTERKYEILDDFLFGYNAL